MAIKITVSRKNNMPAPKATAIIIRDNKVLLVRVDWRPYAMPGANIQDPRDPAIANISRLVSEVLDIDPISATRLESCDVTDGRYAHKAVLIGVDPRDHPVIMKGVTDFIWWDRVTPITHYNHVTEILDKYDQIHKDSNT
jgi:hypothetical protein